MARKLLLRHMWQHLWSRRDSLIIILTRLRRIHLLQASPLLTGENGEGIIVVKKANPIIAVQMEKGGDVMFKKIFVFMVILALFFAGCGKAAWQEFSSDKGKFSVMVPLPPEEKVEPVNLPQIGTVNMITYTVEQRDGAYMATYADYPYGLFQQTTPDKVLDGVGQGMARGSSTDGKVVSEQKIMVENNPGRDLVIEGTRQNVKFIMKARIALVSHRLYQIAAVMPKDQSTTIDAAKFLDSFKLK